MRLYKNGPTMRSNADGALGLMFVDGTGDLVADEGECLDSFIYFGRSGALRGVSWVSLCFS